MESRVNIEEDFGIFQKIIILFELDRKNLFFRKNVYKTPEK